jgi:hypothetical protein
LSFPGDGCLVALEIGHFEETLVNPRSADSQRSQFLHHFPGLNEPIKADVGIQ